MDELKDLLQVTITDILFYSGDDPVELEFVDATFDTDRSCLMSIEVAYQNECINSGTHTATFCTALCNYSAAIFVDAVRETVSNALMKGEK